MTRPPPLDNIPGPGGLVLRRRPGACCSPGLFDLVVSALAVHHPDGAAKADLFRRVAAALRPFGRFVFGDVIVPDDTADVVTPIDGAYDRNRAAAEQPGWLRAAGSVATATLRKRDLAVLVGDR